MRSLVILILILFSTAKCISQQPIEQKEAKNKIGFNLTKLVTGDLEFLFIHQSDQHFSIGGSLGYDFNFLDKGLYHHDIDFQKRMESKEEQTDAYMRYFFGKGPVARINFDYNFNVKKNRQHFFSLEFMLKIRNYRDHFFGDMIVYLENADQQIFGISIFKGSNYFNKKSIGRFYYGFGFRSMNSQISRPEFIDGSYNIPPQHFNYYLIIPSVHIGFSFLWSK